MNKKNRRKLFREIGGYNTEILDINCYVRGISSSLIISLCQIYFKKFK